MRPLGAGCGCGPRRELLRCFGNQMLPTQPTSRCPTLPVGQGPDGDLVCGPGAVQTISLKSRPDAADSTSEAVAVWYGRTRGVSHESAC